MNEKFTTASFQKAYSEKRKITVLTAYDYSTARILDDAGVDAILVGDSLGMVMLGYEDTTKVTMQDMQHHCAAVARGVRHAMVVGDMPFLSYHTGVHEAVRNAGSLIQAGCNAVKLEGGAPVAETVKAMIAAGIPVMGHLGYTPQSINVFGGHKAQGKSVDTAVGLLEDAIELQKAGCFSIVFECVPYKVAENITRRLEIPTIGIGSGAGCAGQVLVVHDLLGTYRVRSDRGSELFIPKHAKKYADVGNVIEQAAREYINEVTNGVFPVESNSFKVSDEVMEILEKTEI